MSSVVRAAASAATANTAIVSVDADWGVPAVGATRVGLGLRIPVVVALDSGELVALDDIRYGLQRRWIDRRAIAAMLRRAARVTVCTSYTAAMPPLGGRHVEIV